MKHLRTVEKPSGRGYITMADGKKVSVRYALVVVEAVDDDIDTGHLAGHAEIRGTIVVDRDEGLVDLNGKHFRLKTNDGRCLEAWAQKGDHVTQQWEIVTTSGKGFQPC